LGEGRWDEFKAVNNHALVSRLQETEEGAANKSGGVIRGEDELKDASSRKQKNFLREVGKWSKNEQWDVITPITRFEGGDGEGSVTEGCKAVFESIRREEE